MEGGRGAVPDGNVDQNAQDVDDVVQPGCVWVVWWGASVSAWRHINDVSSRRDDVNTTAALAALVAAASAVAVAAAAAAAGAGRGAPYRKTAAQSEAPNAMVAAWSHVACFELNVGATDVQESLRPWL